ncbi:hypothetical protein G3O06_07730 [Burkholderia sp. Ac-20345]|uniref:hypothetical protein n=1 Tax=Burkholderia sp. Ac-20345 TaxID=2703891 RepID=UPI00197B0B7F|nr:hypothetical protein [Burkholderia sp. Ac-20345]MBN3777440.1 hypothetical protein [Burkholderia sp. Ac-20345]
MPKQFAYRDAHGKVYPAHAALAFQPGLVPGHYDTDTRQFTPIGNPQQQTGTIITDAAAGHDQKLLSGLGEDRGANTAPIGAGVAFTLTPLQAELDAALARSAELDGRVAELESELSDERERSAALEAQVAVLTHQLQDAQGTQGANGPGTSGSDGGTSDAGDPPADTGTNGGTSGDAEQDDAQTSAGDAGAKRARKVTP